MAARGTPPLQITAPGGRTRAACLAHAGRHLFEALATAPEVRHALDLIRDVYVVEHEATLQNNIFDAQSGNGVLTTGGGIAYQNNLYFGSTIQVPAGDTHPITADPKLASPGTGQSGSASGPAFGSLTGYQLQTGSPAINGGVNIANNGGLDFWGTALPTSSPDVGAYQAPLTCPPSTLNSPANRHHRRSCAPPHRSRRADPCRRGRGSARR